MNATTTDHRCVVPCKTCAVAGGVHARCAVCIRTSRVTSSTHTGLPSTLAGPGSNMPGAVCGRCGSRSAQSPGRLAGQRQQAASQQPCNLAEPVQRIREDTGVACCVVGARVLGWGRM